MYGRRFGLRWIVLAAFIVFALVSFGALYLDRYKASSQNLLSSTPTASAVAKSSQAAATPTQSLPSQAAATPTQSLAPTASSTPGSRPSPSVTPTRPTASPSVSPDDLLVLVDKQYSLPASYAPTDLVALTTVRTTKGEQRVRRVILPSLEKLMADAKAAGFELVVSSSYRSYSEQESVHAYWERTLGKAEADRVSAVAGQSEHQLGTTLDLTSASVGYDLVEKFGATPEGRWLRDNAYRYGFVISYPEGKEAITGYAYEPWHIRYVGVETATLVRQKGVTLDEYLRSRR